jgi:hypothetical protein
VDLSQVQPPPSTMRARKTTCEGGTFSTTLFVQPRFTFTNPDNPTRILDTGVEGIPPIQLDLADGHPWVHDLDPNLHLPGAECTNFHPGISEPNTVPDCDCNFNFQRDLCDIEQGISEDCNQNLVPDECDPDPDLDGITEQCDNCPGITNPLQEDFDADTIGDPCDECPLMPRAFETDHDGDRVRMFPNEVLPEEDNCPCVPNYDQADADGDGVGDVCDADAGDVLGLLLGKSGTDLTLSWNPSCAATDDNYAIYEGTIAGLGPGYDHTSIDCDTGGLTSQAVTPAAGDRYYLVVPTNDSAFEGSYGRTSGGVERPPGTGACEPQALGCP